MSETSTEEYAEKMRARYARLTGRKARSKLLDEFVEITGWELLKLWSQWRNLFCVTMKQESKRREGSRQIRRHEKNGRTPAQRLIDSGELRQEQRMKLEEQLASLNPFAMRKEIRRLEDRLWSRREALYEKEERAALTLAGAPPLRSEAPARVSKPTTRNQAATVVFITNNFDWSPQSVCDLYRRRWDIEVFFKQVKQSLKLGSFLGHNASAVKWQVYTALMVYVLLRYMAHLSQWGHSFTRLFAVVRSTVWERIGLLALLKPYGTASVRFRVLGALNQAWLPGFVPSGT